MTAQGKEFTFGVDDRVLRVLLNDVGLGPHGDPGDASPFKGASPGWVWAHGLVTSFAEKWDADRAERWEHDAGDVVFDAAENAVPNESYEQALVWADLGGGHNVSDRLESTEVPHNENGSPSRAIREYIEADLYGAARALLHVAGEQIAAAWAAFHQVRCVNCEEEFAYSGDAEDDECAEAECAVHTGDENCDDHECSFPHELEHGEA